MVQDLQQLYQWDMEGKIKVDVAQVYPFTVDNVQQAMNAISCHFAYVTSWWHKFIIHPSLTVAVVMHKEWIQVTKRSGRCPIWIEQFYGCHGVAVRPKCDFECKSCRSMWKTLLDTQEREHSTSQQTCSL